MGALPKNKITRAERGKRRAGNTPSLKKQANHTTVPLHKRGLVSQLLKTLGISTDTRSSEPKTKTAKTNKKVAKAPEQVQNKAIQAKLARENNRSQMQKGVNKPAVRRTSLNKDA